MPFNHSDHYHDLLLRGLPTSCRRALDTGCGTGGFAWKLALREIEVDAIDVGSHIITAAREQTSELALPGNIHFDQADINNLPLPPAAYDYITCLASLHHVPFRAVQKLCSSLTKNGFSVILGHYREAYLWDHSVTLLVVSVNVTLRAVAFFQEKRTTSRPKPHNLPLTASTTPSLMPLSEIYSESAKALPGKRILRLLFWRYLLVSHKGEGSE
ncbi:class I SAM-dependent methyltransferase [Streptomyces filamentosus]|uniref:class I SAM-dependent methyltransferase n=1 Tax=Streptomyces filamentosus TaxID=67294 RepID=UPI0033D703FA